jgi:hypothetical protein
MTLSKTLRIALSMLLAAGAVAAAADVVVLKGGTRIELKQPPVRRGNNVLLTRKDGTLLSVPYSDIDSAATAAVKGTPAPAAPASAAAAPPETPAEAARAAQQGPKARVKVTDADVGHYLESPESPEAAAGEGGAEAASGAAGDARVDVSDYSQSQRDDNLIVKGMLRNLGTATALNVRLTVTPMDEKGKAIDSVEASVSNGTLEAGKAVNFTATVPVGKKTVGTMRFSPRWVTQAPPAAAAPPGSAAAPAGAVAASAAPGAAPAAAAAPATAAARPPAPTPNPYGQGTLYAAPAPNAPSVAPADGKTGYIPGAATPENQPKPPE